MPNVSVMPFEAHPFTIANMPGAHLNAEEGDVVLIIRACDGFTKRLMNKAQTGVRIPAFVEGPYGHGCRLNHYEQVLLVCGGSGITFGTSNLIAIIDAAKQGTSAVRRVKLVWMIRDKTHWEWVQALLTPIIADLPESLIVDIDIHVTTVPVEPALTVEEEAYGHEIAVPQTLYDGSSSGTGSGNSSKEDLECKVENEKTEQGSGSMKATITWHNGRAILRDSLNELVSVAQGRVSANGECLPCTFSLTLMLRRLFISPSVCGPRGLQLALADAVKEVSSTSRVLDGQSMVTYYSESFGW